MPLSTFSGVIPPTQSTAIIQEAMLASAALSLGTRVPMGTTISQMPVPSSFPVASWVTAAGGANTGRKPYTSLGLVNKQMTAEEVAAIVAIPDAMIEDSTINLWAFARPLLSQAIAIALDQAVLFGVNAPATFPAGGVAAEAVTATPVPAGTTDAVALLNGAMGAVEGQGLTPTGDACDLRVRAKLRGERANTGELLLGTTQADTYSQSSLYGLPVSYVNFDSSVLTGASQFDLIVGDWSNLIIGVRQDIRYDMNPAAVIADSAGVVQVSGWQDNVTPLKVWARFACVIIRPPTVRVPAGARAFSKANLQAATLLAAEASAAHKK